MEYTLAYDSYYYVNLKVWVGLSIPIFVIYKNSLHEKNDVMGHIASCPGRM